MRKWFQKFRIGDESIEVEGRERACSHDNKQLQAVFEQSSRQSMREVSQTLGVNTGAVSRYLQSIRKVKTSINSSLISSLSIINIRDLKSAQYFVCVTPIVPS